MEGYRRSNIHGSMQPSMREERVPSLYETRSNYEAAQLNLMAILRVILIVMGIIVAVLLFRTFFKSDSEGDSAHKGESIIGAAFRYFMEYLVGEKRTTRASTKSNTSTDTDTKGPKIRFIKTPEGRLKAVEDKPETEVKKEGFWASLMPSFGCKDWKNLQEKLKNQKFSIRHYLPELPSTEAIRANPNRFNISLTEISKKSTEELKKDHPPEEVLKNLAAIAGFYNQDPKIVVAQDNEKAQKAERSMKEPEQADLQFKLADTVGSFRFLLGKRQKLIELRSRVQDSLNALNECESNERNLDTEYYNLKNEGDDLRRQLSALGEEEQEINTKIKQKERNLSEADKRAREIISALSAKLAEVKAASGRKASIELDIQARLRKITAIDVEIDRIKAGEPDLVKRIENMQVELQWIPSKQANLKDKLKLLKASHESFERKRNILLTHKDLKEKLLKLVPEAEKTKDLADKFSETIEKEKSLKELAEKVSANPNEIQIIDDFIKEDKEIFHTWMKLFAEMEKEVNKFEGGEAYITIIERSLAQSKENIAENIKELSQLESDEKSISQELHRLQQMLNSSREKLNALQQERASLNDWIENHKRLIADSERNQKSIESEIANQQNLTQKERQALVENFGNVDQERSKILESMSSIKSRIVDNQSNVKAIEVKLERSKDNCAALKAFYMKTAEMVPLLDSTLAADKKTLLDLKDQIQKQLEPFTAL